MAHGSSYETYEQTHTDYDKTRLAVGCEQLIDLIERRLAAPSASPQREGLRILDAGCGTGSLLEGLAAAGFGNLTGVDASATGVAHAVEKLGSRAKLVCGDIRQMPFPEGSFDVVIFSFVVHHLPHQNEAELLAATSELMKHAASLVAAGGVLAVITCTPEQMSADQGCMWYYKYFPEAANQLASRFLPTAKLNQALTESGLKEPQLEPVRKTYWTEASLDPNGPQDSAWRSGDSLFALCQKNADLFEAQLQQLKRDVETGVAQEHIGKVRARAETIKQAVLVTASK